MAEVPHIDADTVINKRQQELIAEVQDWDAKIAAHKAELMAMSLKREERMMEYEMWDRHGNRNEVKVLHTTTTTVEVRSGRMNHVDRLSFENCLKKVMLEAGRPLKFGDIRTRLGKFGWVWTNYAGAHNQITRCGMLERFKDAHGMFQLIRR